MREGGLHDEGGRRPHVRAAPPARCRARPTCLAFFSAQWPAVELEGMGNAIAAVMDSSRVGSEMEYSASNGCPFHCQDPKTHRSR